MGASFAVPEKISMLEKYEDLDESVLLAGSFDRRNLPKLSETNDIENRIQKAVMERVDIFLEGFKDKLAQSLLANCSGAHLSCRSLLDGNSANSSSHGKLVKAISYLSMFVLRFFILQLVAVNWMR
jgi:hypothetical protein